MLLDGTYLRPATTCSCRHPTGALGKHRQLLRRAHPGDPGHRLSAGLPAPQPAVEAHDFRWLTYLDEFGVRNIPHGIYINGGHPLQKASSVREIEEFAWPRRLTCSAPMAC
jgi:hypothetical protein